MGFAAVKQLVEQQVDRGAFQATTFRKVVSNATAAGIWCDLSYSPGNPVANFYATEPLAAATLDGTRGLFHGANVSPETKHLVRMHVQCVTAAGVPLTLLLCDYLLYYPFIDMDSTDPQDLTNTVTLPRHTSGDGVQAFLVAQGAYTGGASFTLNYTNQAGVAGRTTVASSSNSGTFAGSLVTSGAVGVAGARGPFVTLQAGDTGIRSVEQVTFLAPNGGIAALVLCRPLATLMLREITAPSERDFVTEMTALPRVVDGAYLNFLALPNASLSTVPILGMAEFAWG